MASPAQFYELYRRSSCGVALLDALDELVGDRRITPQLAMRILSNFDRSFTEALVHKAKARLMFKGHLKTYRFCDEVWTLIIKNPQFRFENETLQVDKVKIVACNSKKPGEV